MLTEEIKFRVAPLDKSTLLEIAHHEGLDLSDIMRRAARELIRKEMAQAVDKLQQQRFTLTNG